MTDWSIVASQVPSSDAIGQYLRNSGRPFVNRREQKREVSVFQHFETPLFGNCKEFRRNPSVAWKNPAGKECKAVECF